MRAPPVLLLHGWGGSFASSFAAHGWLDALAEAGRSPVAMDLPGHGETPASRCPVDYADLTGAVAARLPIGELDVIGYSLGAKLALAFAARFPARVRRLVALGVGDNLFAPELSGEAVAEALTHGLSDHASPAVRNLVEYSKASRSDPLALAAVLRRAPNPIVDPEDLAEVGERTLLINGDKDALALPDDKLRAALPGLRCVRLSGLGHLDLPADGAVRRAAIDFLGAVSQRETAPAALLVQSS